jgi:hypothetical protein
MRSCFFLPKPHIIDVVHLYQLWTCPQSFFCSVLLLLLLLLLCDLHFQRKSVLEWKWWHGTPNSDLWGMIWLCMEFIRILTSPLTWKWASRIVVAECIGRHTFCSQPTQEPVLWIHGCFFSRINNGFSRTRIYLSGCSAGQGISQIRTMWIEAFANSSTLIWYTRDQFIKFTGTVNNSMKLMQLAHCSVHFFITVIACHTGLTLLKVLVLVLQVEEI